MKKPRAKVRTKFKYKLYGSVLYFAPNLEIRISKSGWRGRKCVYDSSTEVVLPQSKLKEIWKYLS